MNNKNSPLNASYVFGSLLLSVKIRYLIAYIFSIKVNEIFLITSLYQKLAYKESEVNSLF